MDEHKAALIRRMFEAYATGRHTFDSLHELVTSWKLTSHHEKPIARSMLPKLLANDFYIGLFCFIGETHEGTHRPIIPKELFDEVQNVMARRGRPHKMKSAVLPYLGFMRCGECGGAITGERQKGHHYYRCTKKLGPCSQKRFIREESLTEALRAGIRQVSIPQGDGALMLAEMARWRQEESGTRAEQLGREKTALATVESRLSRLLDVYLDGSISHDDYAAKKQEILLEKAAIKERMARIREQGNAWLEPVFD